MARVYATEQEYRDWVGDDQVEVTPAQMARASRSIDGLLVGAVYETDPDGLPVSTTMAVILSDATCAQLQSELNAEAVAAGQQLGKVTQASIGSASYTLESPGYDRLALDSQGVSSEARRILRLAGLYPTSPYVYG